MRSDVTHGNVVFLHPRPESEDEASRPAAGCPANVVQLHASPSPDTEEWRALGALFRAAERAHWALSLGSEWRGNVDGLCSGLVSYAPRDDDRAEELRVLGRLYEDVCTTLRGVARDSEWLAPLTAWADALAPPA